MSDRDDELLVAAIRAQLSPDQVKKIDERIQAWEPKDSAFDIQGGE